MNFNLFNLNGLLALLLIPTLGCGLKIGEKVKPTDVVEFKNGSCLSDSNKITKSFFKGEAEENKVGDAVDCYANVIETFRDNVRGAESEAFSPEEIQVFLKNNFLKDSDFDLSLSLVQELMKVKVLIAGGTRYRVTHAELTALSEVLREIKGDIVALNPVMPLVIGLDTIETHTILTENPRLQAEFSVQGQVFKTQLLKISKIFRHDHLNYKVEELFNLVLEILKSNHNDTATIEKFELLKPLVAKAAEVLIDDRQILDVKSWPRLLNALGDGYMAYRRYDLLVNDDTKSSGLDQLTMQKIVIDVHPTLEMLIAQKSSASISNAEIFELLKESKILFSEKFLDSADLAKWVQKVLDLKSYNLLMQTLWTHLLNDPVQRVQGKATNALDATALNTIAYELGYLFRAQFNVHRMFESFKVKGITASKSEIQNYLRSILAEGQTWATDLDRLYANEQMQMFNSPAILVFDENNYLKISDPSNTDPNTAYTIKDVEKSSYARAGSRLLIRAFTTDLNSALLIKHISKVDTLFAWELVRPIVIELDLVQPDNLTFISSRFREADLFISSSNGDDIGQFTEAHDLILHIYSGQKRSDTLRKDIVQRCMPGTDPESYKHKDTMDEVCLIQHYTVAENGFQSLPKYQELITLFPTEMPNYAMSLLKAAGHKPNPQKLVKFEDLDLYPHVAQYIEMLFNKFDTNRDGILDKFEAVAAYPTYLKIVAEVLEKIGFDGMISQPERRKGVFLYLLQKGRGPENAVEVKEFTKFINDTRDLNTTDRWTINPNRISLGQLFNFLADKLDEPGQKAP